MEIIFLFFIYLAATFGLVNLLGWLLTRPSVNVWRQELTAPRWQRAAYVFGFSPMVTLPLVDHLLRSWRSALSPIVWIRPLPVIGMGLILLFIPVLAACWLAAPQYEGERFSDVRAWIAALTFTVADVIGASVVNALFSL